VARFVVSIYDFLFIFVDFLSFRLGARSQTRGASWPREIFVLARSVRLDGDWPARWTPQARHVDKSDARPEKLAEFACVAATQKSLVN